MSETMCPYCHQPLEEAPKRKKNCPNCGEFIYVRHGDLYTEDEAQEYDYLDSWLHRLDSAYGFGKADFESHRAQMSEQRGSKADAHDTVWSILNNIQVEIDPRSFPDRAMQISRDMADFYEQEGRDFAPHIAQVNKVKALRFKRKLEAYQAEPIGDNEWLESVNYLEIIGSPDNQSCEYCRSLHRKILRKAEVPIVPLNCTAKYGCRCVVVAVVDQALPEGFQPHESAISKSERTAAKEETVVREETGKPWWQFWK